VITADKLKIYEAFRGDLDMWVRAGSGRDKEMMSDADWRQIEQLLGEITLVDRGLASEDFARRVETSLRDNTADAMVAAQLRQMASEVDHPKRWWKFW
jgi:hypothetical protein